jgi:hypothetical protein
MRVFVEATHAILVMRKYQPASGSGVGGGAAVGGGGALVGTRVGAGRAVGTRVFVGGGGFVVGGGSVGTRVGGRRVNVGRTVGAGGRSVGSARANNEVVRQLNSANHTNNPASIKRRAEPGCFTASFQ